MTRYIKFVCPLAVLCTATVFAQITPTSSPVAFVYVSNAVGGNNYEINAFAAASNGKLTRVTGSPFPADVQNMAVNGKYLFGTNGIDIDSFSIAPDGSLTEVAPPRPEGCRPRLRGMSRRTSTRSSRNGYRPRRSQAPGRGSRPSSM